MAGTDDGLNYSCDGLFRSLCIFCYDNNIGGKRKRNLDRRRDISASGYHDPDKAATIKGFVSFLEGFVGWDEAGSEAEMGLKELGICKNCVGLVKSLSAVYEEMKKARMQVLVKLETLVEGMKMANKVPTRLKEMNKRILYHGANGTRRLKKLQSFREGVITKCGEKLSECQPFALPEEKDEDPHADFFSREVTEEDGDGGGDDEDSGSSSDHHSRIPGTPPSENSRASRPVVEHEVMEDDDQSNEDLMALDELDSVENALRAELEDAELPEDIPTDPPEDPLDNRLLATDDEIRNPNASGGGGGGGPSYRCNFCEKSFFHKSRLERHFTQDHYNFAAHFVPETTSSSSSTKQRYHCGACNASFVAATSLRRHEKAGCGVVAGTSQQQRAFERINKRNSATVPKQEIEDNEDDSEDDWDWDKDKSDPEFAYICQVGTCRKRFSVLANFNKHMKQEHQQDKNRLSTTPVSKKVRKVVKKKECPECGKAFRTKQHLEEHIYTHRDQETWPFQCTECGKRWPTKSRLTKHMSIHSAANPFPCQYCTATYSHRQKLSNHVRQCHRDQQNQEQLAESLKMEDD